MMMLATLFDACCVSVMMMDYLVILFPSEIIIITYLLPLPHNWYRYYIWENVDLDLEDLWCPENRRGKHARYIFNKRKDSEGKTIE